VTIFIPARRTTLFLPSGPRSAPNQEHLFILLTDPIPPDNDVLVVNISSVNKDFYHDPTCLLYPGDHSFVTRKSYINYRYAEIRSATKLANGATKGTFKPLEMVDEIIFARICKGVEDSRHTPLKAKKFFANAGK